MLKFIQKRDGRIAPFDISLIANAIYKASLAVGAPNQKLAQKLAKKVVARLKEKLAPKEIPSVEQVQDFVEQTLIEARQFKIAKAYILYRQRRAGIRREKEQILNKTAIDEVDKRFDINALKVLASRYLRKNEQGKIIESPKELFERVAIHAVLASLFYDSKIYKNNAADYKKKSGLNDFREQKLDAEKLEFALGIGRYKLNRFHLHGVERLFNFFSKCGRLKINSLAQFLDLLKRGYFDKYEDEISRYYDLMINRQFFPNTPALINFGNFFGMGSACFTLDIEDSLVSIMDTLKSAAIIFQSGGGVGYNFSKLRPEGDFVKSTAGIASGPVSFMRLYDAMTEIIKQGGVRRGANMGILNISHPDIEKFIKAKTGNLALRNFNISVLITPDFWEYYKKGEPFSLINPRNREVVKKVDPRRLFDLIVYEAWESAEPGVIFFDRINRFNPFYQSLGPIVSSNPCGELPLYPNESCNLGSINVSIFVKGNDGSKKKFDWQGLKTVVRTATRFLDNVIDVNKYPLPEIEKMTLSTRKIGLGIMGIGDLLYELRMPYNSKSGLKLMERLIEFVNYHSKAASIELSKERGKFPYFERSFYKEGKLPFSGFLDKKSWHFDWNIISKNIKKYGIRNSQMIAIAPTGSISMIAGCSSGMEPVYSLVFEKSVTLGRFYYVNPIFEIETQKRGLMDEALLKDVAAFKGSVQKLNYIPAELKKVFITALDIKAEDHIRALACFQKWTDASVSKTNNFPAEATVEDMKKSYLLAYELGCKDVTVFRDTSIKQQVLIAGGRKQEKKGLTRIKDEKVRGLVVYQEVGAEKNKDGKVEPRFLGGAIDLKKCPSCGASLIIREGCKSCFVCGWGLCE